MLLKALGCFGVLLLVSALKLRLELSSVRLLWLGEGWLLPRLGVRVGEVSVIVV